MTNKQYFHVYDKWSEFMDACKVAKPNSVVREPASRTDESNQSEPWSGCETWQQALKWLDRGWAEGIDSIKRAQKTIPSDLFDAIMPVTDYQPEMRHNIAGGALDVGTFVSGATPNNFVVQHTSDEGQKVHGRKLLTIYVQAFNSCVCGQEAFTYRGAYTMALVEHLESCGYSVELWNVMYATSRYDRRNIREKVYVKVKEFGEMMDTNKLALALCSKFFFRRYMFALLETYDDVEAAVMCNNAYGYPLEDVDNTIGHIVLPEDLDLNPIFIPIVNIETPEMTLQAYRKLLSDYLDGNVLSA